MKISNIYQDEKTKKWFFRACLGTDMDGKFKKQKESMDHKEKLREVMTNTCLLMDFIRP